MAGKPIPRPSVLDNFQYDGVKGGERRWSSGRGKKKRYYTWDGLHGEIEVFDSQGWHLGAIDPITGLGIKPATKGRNIDV